MRQFLLYALIVALPGILMSQEKSAKTYEFPFLNPANALDDRVDDLVSRMTLEEKAFQLFNAAPAIERLKVPAYDWWNEALHGVARAGKATVFPQAIGMAATFNPDLMFNIATTISDEARAKHHYFIRNGVRSIYTGLTFWSPNINIFRDPRWGRGQETYGEDPYLTGVMGVNFINGLQGDDPKYFKTIATAKHYAVHSGPEASRHSDNYFVNDRDLYQTYLPAFKMVVQEANVQSVMCAYNRFRDKPCCGSDLLLQDILRDEFGFSGYVVTDCGAVTDFYQKDKHHVVDRPAQAWGWALASGADLNCETNAAFIKDNFDLAVDQGMINVQDINRAVKRLFKARFQLGLFDPLEGQPYTNIPIEDVGSAAHLDLALEAAKQSLVLLKNDGILPLQKDVKVALIGPNADNEDVLLGNYNGIPIQAVTPYQALKKRLKNNLTYEAGTPLVPGFYGHMNTVPESVLFHEEAGSMKQGLVAKYYKQLNMEGEPDLQRIDASIDFIWEKTPISQQLEESFAVSWSGSIQPEISGDYQFRMNTLYARSKIFIDGKELGDGLVSLKKGKTYQLLVDYEIEAFWWGNTVTPEARLMWVNTSEAMEKSAMEAANRSDVIVFCGGISPRLEGEEMNIEVEGFHRGDRTDLKLPKVQGDLLKKLQETGKPIIYVNFSGSAIALNWEAQHVSAIVQAFYPGEPAGEALAELLFGEFSPSGRLPITFYKSIEELPAFTDYSMDNRTYRYFDGDVLYPFGYGLSYTDFTYSDLKITGDLQTDEAVGVAVKVKNTGNMDSFEVVQLYLSDKEASVPVPIKSLVGVQKVFLKKGESKEISFTIQSDQLSLMDVNMRKIVEPSLFEVNVNDKVKGTFELTGKPFILK